MEEIYQLLWSLGITARYKGFDFLATAVAMVQSDEDLLRGVTQRLYRMVAEQYDTTWNNVERDIRSVIKVCWKRSEGELRRIAKYDLDRRPGTVDFLAILTRHLVDERNKKTPV